MIFRTLKYFLQSNLECLNFHIYLFISSIRILCVLYIMLCGLLTQLKDLICVFSCVFTSLSFVYKLMCSSYVCMVSMLWLCLVFLLCLDSFQCGSWKTSSSSLCAFNIQVVTKDQTKKLILQCIPELAWFHELHTAVLSSHHLFPTHNDTLKSLYWIGVNYQHQVDLPDTQGLSLRDVVIKCLESVSRAMPQLQSDPEPSSSPPPIDGYFTRAQSRLEPGVTCDMWPVPKERRTGHTIALELKHLRQSDQRPVS